MKKNKMMVLIGLLLLVMNVAYANECSIDYIINGGFEEPIVPMGVGIQNPSPEQCFWTTGAGAYSELLDDIQLGGMGYPFPPEGYQVMYVTGGKLTQNTGLIIEEGKTYNAGVKMLTVAAASAGQYVKIAFEDENGNVLAISESFLPSLPQSQWTDFEFSMSTAAYPDAVGKELVVALHSMAYVYFDVFSLYEGYVGDLDGSCSVGIADIYVMASQWLEDNKTEQTIK